MAPSKRERKVGDQLADLRSQVSWPYELGKYADAVVSRALLVLD
jgi:hypothetical protein